MITSITTYLYFSGGKAPGKIALAILGSFDGKMPVLKIGESAEQNLKEAVGKWIQYGSKGRDQFYKWLEKKGYFGHTVPEEEDPNANTTFKTGPVTPHGTGSPFNVIPGTGTYTPADKTKK